MLSVFQKALTPKTGKTPKIKSQSFSPSTIQISPQNSNQATLPTILSLLTNTFHISFPTKKHCLRSAFFFACMPILFGFILHYNHLIQYRHFSKGRLRKMMPSLWNTVPTSFCFPLFEFFVLKSCHYAKNQLCSSLQM